MINEISIREYVDNSKDKNEVYSLIRSILENEFTDVPTDIYMSDIGNIPEVYGGDGEIFLVAEHQGKVVATVGIKRDDEEVALMRRLFVDAEYRSQGVARLLVTQALEFCAENGYASVAFSGNTQMHRVRKVLKRAGFHESEDMPFANIGIFKMTYDVQADEGDED